MLEQLKSKGFIKSGVITNQRNEAMDIASLPAILRTLLVTDGTVTKTLEAYFWEPLRINQLEQQVVTVEQPIDILNCRRGEELLDRQVSIQGETTGRMYAYASSMLRLSLLPEKVKQQLINGEIGIGELLRDQDLETYRQLIDIFREAVVETNPASAEVNCAEMICRTYHIFYHHKPVIQVTEKFPLNLYQSNT